MQAALVSKINIERMVNIADVRTTTSFIDNGIYPYLSICASQNFATSIFSGSPYYTTQYASVDFKLCSIYTIVMVRIVRWVYSRKILKIIGYDCIFFKETGIGICRVLIAIGIYPSLIEIRSSCYRIGYTCAREFRSWNLVAGYWPICPSTVFGLKYASWSSANITSVLVWLSSLNKSKYSGDNV